MYSLFQVFSAWVLCCLSPVRDLSSLMILLSNSYQACCKSANDKERLPGAYVVNSSTVAPVMVYLTWPYMLDWKFLGSPNPQLCQQLHYCEMQLQSATSSPANIQTKTTGSSCQLLLNSQRSFLLDPPCVFWGPTFVNILTDGSYHQEDWLKQLYLFSHFRGLGIFWSWVLHNILALGRNTVVSKYVKVEKQMAAGSPLSNSEVLCWIKMGMKPEIAIITCMSAFLNLFINCVCSSND